VYISFLLSSLSVALGVVLTIVGGVGGANSKLLLPLRSFAMAALLSSVLLHLLPEAIFVGGGWTMLAFLAGLILPNTMSWLFGRASASWSNRANSERWSHRRIVLLFSLVGVLIISLAMALRWAILPLAAMTITCIGTSLLALSPTRCQ
jgi:hypothetical protein